MKAKSLVSKFPECYLIVILFLAGYTPPLHLHPFFIISLVLLILQTIFQHKVSGLILGGLFFIINLFFIGALLSEFNEFTDFNSNAQQLLVVGMAIWILNVIVSLSMIYKYMTMNSKVLLK